MAQVQCEVEEGSVNSSPSEATPSEICPAETLIATLPTREGWSTPLILYKKFWFRSAALRSLILAPAKFVPRHDDTILATHPKSGTTWLKALAFTVANRHRYTFADHPLLTRIPQDVVPFLEITPGGLDYVEKMPSPRLISTHCPFSVLPPGISSSGCRIVYLCREPKDTFVSRWHFERSMCKADPIGINDAFNLFYEGCTPYRPFWNHNLEYWKESLMRPKEVMFVRYEEIFSDPLKVVRELASFLGVPFTEDEVQGGVVDQVVKVGDWVNHMGKDMAEKLDRLVEDKFKGSGLEI